VHVWLSIAPLADNVVIDLSYDDEQISLDKTQLAFTPSDWDVPQAVTVTAIDNAIYETDPTAVMVTATIADSTD
jgi:hypothetical protein